MKLFHVIICPSQSNESIRQLQRTIPGLALLHLCRNYASPPKALSLCTETSPHSSKHRTRFSHLSLKKKNTNNNFIK